MKQKITLNEKRNLGMKCMENLIIKLLLMKVNKNISQQKFLSVRN
jgi:hypothetical protein